MEVKATVLSLKDNTAYIRVFKESGCQGCSNCPSKNTCHTELVLSDSLKSYECYADNSIGARPGDNVIVATPSKIALMFAFIIFVIPLILFVVAYFLLEKFFNGYSPIILSSAIFVVVFLICAFVSNHLSSIHTHNIIIKIIEENGN